MSELYVGVDVSKEYLDVASSDGTNFRVGNDEAGHQELVTRFSAAMAPSEPAGADFMAASSVTTMFLLKSATCSSSIPANSACA